jgi:hypothetical protein
MRTRTARHIMLIAIVIPLTTLLGCGATTPSETELEVDRTRWASHHLTNYAYDYRTSGFFDNLAGQTVHLVVLGDTLRSAVVVATGDSLPVPNQALATINEMFDLAISNRERGSLAGIEFDQVLGYPRRIDISGPADAAGSIMASSLQPLP